ncbi:MAG: hypothetical protein ACMUHM_09145 [Thermoplasmatota archaeon]
METSLVYQNAQSRTVLLVSMLLPLVPLYVFIFVVYFFEIGGGIILISLLYLSVWLIFFIALLVCIFEVMVVYRDRIVFINPYKERVIRLSEVKMIYYHERHGISFTLHSGKVVKGRFKFDFGGNVLEDVFRALSSFIGFSEEHIKDSNTYCLVRR